MKKIFFVVAVVLLLTGCENLYAQDKNYKIVCVGFYNLENLFDTKNDSLKRDEEFTPDGTNQWTQERYERKLQNAATVIAEMGSDITPDGVAILGVAEVENRKVLEDLVKMPAIKNRNYQIIHFDSPDKRGIDVAFLYNPAYFEPAYYKNYYLKIFNKKGFRKPTRDQLLVSGEMDGEKMHFIINHWPSRSGGEKYSRPFRLAAADLTMYIIQRLRKYDEDAKIVIMGDFNDDPVSKSFKQNLNTQGKLKKLKSNDLYNPWEAIHKKGYGTLAWNDAWNLFDQIIISESLTDKNKEYKDFGFLKAQIFNKPFLQQKTGRKKGYPFRTFSQGIYLGGYSDHFPVMIYLLKEK